MATVQRKPLVDPRQLQFEFVFRASSRAGQVASLDTIDAQAAGRTNPTIRQELIEVRLLPAANKVNPPVDQLAVAECPPETEDSKCSTSEIAQKKADIEFMADHALEFLDWFLTRNLQYLASRGDAVTKKSVIEWIFAPDVDGVVWDFRCPGGAAIPVRQDRIPFTFQWICAVLGLSADDLRTGVIHQLKHARAGAAGPHSQLYRFAEQHACARALENRHD